MGRFMHFFVEREPANCTTAHHTTVLFCHVLIGYGIAILASVVISFIVGVATVFHIHGQVKIRWLYFC